MASIDTNAYGTGGSATINVGDNPNRALFCIVQSTGSGGTTGVSRNGNSFTQVGSETYDGSYYYYTRWKLVGSDVDVGSYAVTASGSNPDYINVLSVYGVDGTDPISADNYDCDSWDDYTPVVVNRQQSSALCISLIINCYGTSMVVQSPFTQNSSNTSSGWFGTSYYNSSSTGNITSDWYESEYNFIGLHWAIELLDGASASLDQEGWRSRNDDDDEANATYRQNQDTDDSVAKGNNIRPRIILDSTGDYPSSAFDLWTKEHNDSDSEYVKIGT